MTFAVFDEGYEVFRFPEFSTDQPDDVDIAHFVMSADVIDFADASFAENQIDRLAMIFDIEPIAHVQALTVDGRRSVVE